jgi:hypothetical protein
MRLRTLLTLAFVTGAGVSVAATAIAQPRDPIVMLMKHPLPAIAAGVRIAVMVRQPPDGARREARRHSTPTTGGRL